MEARGYRPAFAFRIRFRIYQLNLKLIRQESEPQCLFPKPILSMDECAGAILRWG